MTLQLELGHLFSIIGGFAVVIGGFGLLLLRQIDLRLNERFKAQEESRNETRARWDSRFTELAKGQEAERDNWQRIEREMLQMRADFPFKYVLRDDYVRDLTIVMAKLDALYAKIELMLVQGAKQ
jgi:hypothetical protein